MPPCHPTDGDWRSLPTSRAGQKFMCNHFRTAETDNWFQSRGSGAEVEGRWTRVVFSGAFGKLMAASVNSAGQAGAHGIAHGTDATTESDKQNYHPSADGQTFAINAVAGEHRPAVITVVVNSPVVLK